MPLDVRDLHAELAAMPPVDRIVALLAAIIDVDARALRAAGVLIALTKLIAKRASNCERAALVEYLREVADELETSIKPTSCADDAGAIILQ